MKKIRKFKLKSYSRISGKLMPINFDKKLGWIYITSYEIL